MTDSKNDLPEQILFTNNIRVELQGKIDEKVDNGLFRWTVQLIIAGIAAAFLTIVASFLILLQYNNDRAQSHAELKEQLARLEVKVENIKHK